MIIEQVDKIMKKTIVFANGPVGYLFTEKLLKSCGDLISIKAICVCRKRQNIFYSSGHDICEDLAMEFGIPVVDNPLDLSKFDCKFDLGFSFGNFHILKRQTIELFRLGIINFHGSPITWYAGSATPCFHVMNTADLNWGFTFHMLDEGLDTGDILLERVFEAEAHLSSRDLDRLAVVKGLKELEELVRGYIGKRIAPQKFEASGRPTIRRSEIERLSTSTIDVGDISSRMVRAYDWPDVLKHPSVEIDGQKLRLVPFDTYDELISSYRARDAKKKLEDYC